MDVYMQDEDMVNPIPSALFQCHVERNLEKKWICRYKKLAPTTRKNTVPLKKRDS